MRERITGPDGPKFHYEPYELYWEPDCNGASEGPVRVYGELYTSPAFVEAHRALQESPPEPGCSLPRVIVGIMLASDETHLSQFGETKLWPLYLYFGNDSKYRRCKPTSQLANHLAYLIRLPDTFKEFVQQHTNVKTASASLMSHCLREALHHQLDLILDEDFIQAYCHGIVFSCFDNQDRRFYPRFFTFSSDYKDKIIWTGIRNLGARPCPRCLIPIEFIHNMGMRRDSWWRTKRPRTDNAEHRGIISSARSAVLDKNYALHGKHVNEILKDHSLVAAKNSFSNKLSAYGFDIFNTMTVDFMHEIESGNWRSLFIHLLRILDCAAGGSSLIIELDSRYRQVPTFGLDTIRKFRRNCSEMRNLAARDWEDMLQCAIPVFDGLLETKYNLQLLQLLYTFASWHSLAKLRMHTDSTLNLLSDCTTELGTQLRNFKAKTAKAFETRELQKEADARARRTEAAAKKAKERVVTSLSGQGRVPPLSSRRPLETPAVETHVAQTGAPSSLSPYDSGPALVEATTPEISNPPRRYERRPKELNLNTYKFHAMGDYVATIRRLGTIDSYSTEISELEHRTSKARYRRTNRRDYVKQIAQIERRQAHLQLIRSKTKVSISSKRTRRWHRTNSKSVDEPYWVGDSQNHPCDIYVFIRKNAGDPAIKGFMATLKAHILPRAQNMFGQSTADSAQKPISFFLQRDRMYEHQTMRFNYTTYDVRRCQDTINPNTPRRNIMILSPSLEEGSPIEDDEHPFVYAEVLKIFHVNVVCTGVGTDGTPRRLDVLWVRWYQHVRPAGKFQLDRLMFPPVAADNAFGFVDPHDVVRGCHLIPRFSVSQRSPAGIGISRLARDASEWKEYYINRFVDRDMFMRYQWGLAVGHKYTWSSRVTASPPTYCDRTAPEREASETLMSNGRDDDGSNSSDGELGLRDRDNDDLGSEHSSDDDAWEDDVEEVIESDSEVDVEHV